MQFIKSVWIEFTFFIKSLQKILFFKEGERKSENIYH